MKFGVTISTFPAGKRPATFGDGNFLTHINTIKSLGFDGIDIFILPMPKNELVSLKNALIKNDLEAIVIFPVILIIEKVFLGDTDSEKRKKAINLFKKQIDDAQFLNANIVIGLDRGNKKIAAKSNCFTKILSESLEELSFYAMEKNVSIFLEPISRSIINNLNTVEECLEFLYKYNLTFIKLLLDTYHMFREEKSIEKSIKLAKSKIGHIHISDSNRGIPGSGEIDFKKIINTLKEVKYNDYLTIETPPLLNREKALKKSLNMLRNIIKEIN